jgi:hypothetical protein
MKSVDRPMNKHLKTKGGRIFTHCSFGFEALHLTLSRVRKLFKSIKEWGRVFGVRGFNV